MRDVPVSLPIPAILTTAWQKVYGSKGTFSVGIGITIAILIVFGVLQNVTQQLPVLNNTLAFIGQILVLLFQLGLLYIGIQRALDKPIHAKMVFYPFNKEILFKIIKLLLLQILILVLPAIILSFFGVYFASQSLTWLAILFYIGTACFMFYIAIRLYMAVAFILAQASGAWQAIKLSFEATRGHFWHLLLISLIFTCVMMVVLSALILGLYIAYTPDASDLYLYAFIASLPLLIGLFWFIPWVSIAYGEIYKTLAPN